MSTWRLGRRPVQKFGLSSELGREGWASLTILRHTHLNSHRRQRPDLAAEAGDLDAQRPAFGAATAPSPEQTVTDRVLDDGVECAVAELDPKFRTVLLLIDVDQLSYAEVADLLAIPVER